MRPRGSRDESRDSELPSCPFCGGKMTFWRQEGIGWWSHASWADYPSEPKDRFIKCPAYSWRAYEDERERLHAWNTRHPAVGG